jgi:hypothetical protein
MASGEADSTHADELAGPKETPVTPGPAEPQGDRQTMALMPPLALLAAFSAFAHVVLHKLLLPLMAAKKLSLPALLLVASPFTLNLAGVAGLAALCHASVDLVRSRLTHAGRRVLIAGLAGLLVSTIGLAVVMPSGYLMPSHVLVATGALHTLVVQVSMITLRAIRSLAGRTTVALIAAASLFPLAALLVRHADGSFFAILGAAERALPALYGLGELAYLIMPVAAAFVVVPWEDDAQGRVARRAGAVAVCAMGLLFTAAARVPHELYGHLLYATLRLEWALERASLGYAVPLSLAAGAAMAATVSRNERYRQGGAGLWLWLAAGFNPLTPARLLMTALGALLVCRAVIAISEPSEEQRLRVAKS